MHAIDSRRVDIAKPVFSVLNWLVPFGVKNHYWLIRFRLFGFCVLMNLIRALRVVFCIEVGASHRNIYFDRGCAF